MASLKRIGKDLRLLSQQVRQTVESRISLEQVALRSLGIGALKSAKSGEYPLLLAVVKLGSGASGDR